jgi:hypothetical protein
MANGTILFNDGNGGSGGWNGCYFDINSSSEVNTTSPEWVDIDITIDKDINGRHILSYYINKTLAKEYVISDICAAGYPHGVSGDDGIFSFLENGDIKLYYGASFSIYPTMAGTADCWLDRAEYYNYAKSADEITDCASYAYLNTFTDTLGGTAVTGRQDNGRSVSLDNSDNDGRTGTAYFPYTQNGGQYSNYIATGVNPFVNADTSKGLTVSFWQRINGNYYGDLESITFAKSDLDAKKYFCIGTDGYIRFNNGDGGNDPAFSSLGQYFDYTTANNGITNKVWQFVTVEILDDYNFRVYINGILSESVSVAGTQSYQQNGGLLAFLTSAETSLYFGGYTAYWGTCTLSLDNVYCFTRALKPSEVYSLYLNETGTAPAGFVNEFDTMPSLYSGGCVKYSAFEGKEGVLYIPEASCNSDISVSSAGNTLGDNSVIMSGETVTAQYSGTKPVKGWIVVNNSGEITATGEGGNSFTFTAGESSYILCQLWQKGDVNKSATVDIDDISLIIDATAGNMALTAAQNEIADMNSDGLADAFDAAQIDRLTDYSEIITGDVDLDGDCDITDYELAKAHLSGVDFDATHPADLLNIYYLDSRYDGIKNLYGEGTIITQQYYSADINTDRAVDVFDMFFIDRILNSLV